MTANTPNGDEAVIDPPEGGVGPMSRRMSVSMTLDAVRSRTKTVTRRHVDTWKNLKPGDRLTLIEKGMGLPKGAKQVVVAEVEVVDVREEAIGFINAEEVEREGFGGEMTPWEFVRFWCDSHGESLGKKLSTEIMCRRIEWRYLDDEPCTICDGTGIVPFGLPSNGPDPCPACGPDNGSRKRHGDPAQNGSSEAGA